MRFQGIQKNKATNSQTIKSNLKIKCPDCKEKAFLSDDFTFVKCDDCGYEMTYGEYVKYIAYKDPRYSDILSDYKEKKH